MRARLTAIFLSAVFVSVQSANVLGCTLDPSTSSSSSTEVTMGDGSGQSEVQDVSILATDQEFQLGFSSGNATAPLAPGASAAQVQVALNTLPDAPTTVSVTPDAASGYLVTYSGDFNPHSAITITNIFGACQNIMFGPAPTVMMGGTGSVTATTNATPSANYPITFSTTSTDCTVTLGGVVTGVNAGTDNCVVTASQVGGPAWESASATQTLSIQASTPVRLQAFGVD